MYNQIAIQPQNIKSCNVPITNTPSARRGAPCSAGSDRVDTSRLLASSTHYVQPIAIQPQHIKSCNQSPAHHPVGVGLHAQPGLSGHLKLTSIIQLPYTNTPTSCRRGQTDRHTDRQTDIQTDRQTDRHTDRHTDRNFISINHSLFAITTSQPNINTVTPNSELVF